MELPIVRGAETSAHVRLRVVRQVGEPFLDDPAYGCPVGRVDAIEELRVTLRGWRRPLPGSSCGARRRPPSGISGRSAPRSSFELRIGDSTVMIADEFPDMGVLSPLSPGGTYGALHMTTEDVDALWERAV